MNKIKLLDCTIRDGGYLNDWKFGNQTIKNIIGKLIESNVDFVEIGFLRNCKYDKDIAVYNNCEEIKKILPIDKKNTLFTAMALHNKYDINKLEEYDGKTIDALRVTFHDYDIDEGLEFIQKAIDKNYKVFVNPINIMGYSDIQILELLEKVNKIRPYAFSIVDTFGSMMKEDLQRIYLMIEHNLDKSIVIGLHLHENLALSYSLAQEFISMKASERQCIIDASMQGMGRAPGNLCIELVMDYMNKYRQGLYNINPILDGIDDYIMKFKKIEPWGYNTAYALSAQYNLHRNYAEFLLDKGRLRAKQINQILAAVEKNKKTVYDEEYAEKLYQKFQNRQVNDKETLDELKDNLKGRKILILAPGASIETQRATILDFIYQNKPVVIAANFFPADYECDYIFCSNAIRYEALGDKRWQDNLYITSNIPDIIGKRMHIVNYEDLSIDDNGICDNCVILLIKLLSKIDIKEIFVAGFDGYKKEGNNYVSKYLASQHTKGEDENVKLQRYVHNLKEQICMHFLTDSVYI